MHPWLITRKCFNVSLNESNITFEDIKILLRKQKFKCYICSSMMITYQWKPKCLHQFEFDLINKQKNEKGGLSGSPIKDISNLIIKKFFKSTKGKVPIIGVGGIDSGISAYEKIRAGASLLQLYTGLVYKGPFVVAAIKQELAELLRRDGFSSLQKAVGVDSE